MHRVLQARRAEGAAGVAGAPAAPRLPGVRAALSMRAPEPRDRPGRPAPLEHPGAAPQAAADPRKADRAERTAPAAVPIPPPATPALPTPPSTRRWTPTMRAARARAARCPPGRRAAAGLLRAVARAKTRTVARRCAFRADRSCWAARRARPTTRAPTKVR